MGSKNKFWLMKSEPETFSIDDLANCKTTLWDGVRNYQARNFMLNDMQVGDDVLFYHSNASPPGVAGLAKVHKKAVPDPSSFDKNSPYFDEKSTPDRPRWFCVELKFVKKLKNFVSLDLIKNQKKLAKMLLVQRGQRLSIQPVTEAEFNLICQLGTK
ncbi:MAG: EVE domain-containing protein [Bdellovibrionales bacterium]|nr:EVE domain-containing protein [Bdellovibrionales bacterium]